MATAFDILGVPSSASREEIRRAYHALARRWHPDRFANGPERLWAEQKMIEINRAYQELLRGSVAPESGETSFSRVRRLVELGNLAAARQALMRIALRDAEWNFLFGDVLFRLGEYKKAVVYLSVAAHQCPDNRQYRTAYDSARGAYSQRKLQNMLRSMASTVALGARKVVGKNI